MRMFTAYVATQSWQNSPVLIRIAARTISMTRDAPESGRIMSNAVS